MQVSEPSGPIEKFLALGNPQVAADLDRGLRALADDLLRTVPSCVVVSLLLPGLDGEIAVLTSAGQAVGAIRASLAVQLLDGLLVIRAGEAGAFLLLGDDAGVLPTQSGARHYDRHLSFDPAGNRARLAASLERRRWIALATGVLGDRETITPDEAVRALTDRARQADLDVGELARHIADPSAGTLRPGRC